MKNSVIKLTFNFENGENVSTQFDSTNENVTINVFTNFNIVNNNISFGEKLVRVNCYNRENSEAIFNLLKQVYQQINNQNDLLSFQIISDDEIFRSFEKNEILEISLTESYLDTNNRFIGNKNEEGSEDAGREDENIYAILQINLK